MCGFGFPSRSVLDKHSNICYKRFIQTDGKRSAATHMEADLPSEKPTNSETQDSQKDLATTTEGQGQAASIEGADDFICTVCSKSFTQAIYLQRHTRVHTDATFICSECGEEFLHINMFRSHSSLHMCTLCGQENNCRLKMLKHKAKIILYTCSICKKPFCMKTDLDKHVNSLSCSVCGELFCSTCKLKEHERHHTEIWSNSCFLCGRGYDTKDGLKAHAKSHCNKGEYACTLCKNLYTNKQELIGHACDYVSEKSEKCFLCGMRLCHNETMKVHVKKNPHLS